MQTAYGFSEYEIRFIRYFLTALFYDCSKLAFFGIYYYCTKEFISFLFVLFPLILLRMKNGGIHFKKYWSCFLFTFAYFELSIRLLPMFFHLPLGAIYCILPLYALLDWLIGPNSLTRKKAMNVIYIKKAKIQTFLLIMLLEILFLIFPANRYLIVSFWTVTLHTIQLGVTKIIKEVFFNEEVCS